LKTKIFEKKAKKKNDKIREKNTIFTSTSTKTFQKEHQTPAFDLNSMEQVEIQSNEQQPLPTSLEESNEFLSAKNAKKLCKSCCINVGRYCGLSNHKEDKLIIKPELFQKLKYAIQNKLMIKILYQSLNNEKPAVRTVVPIKFLESGEEKFLANCQSAHIDKTYYVNSISDLQFFNQAHETEYQQKPIPHLGSKDKDKI